MLIYVTILIILMLFSEQAHGRPTWSPRALRDPWFRLMSSKGKMPQNSSLPPSQVLCQPCTSTAQFRPTIFTVLKWASSCINTINHRYRLHSNIISWSSHMFVRIIRGALNLGNLYYWKQIPSQVRKCCTVQWIYG